MVSKVDIRHVTIGRGIVSGVGKFFNERKGGYRLVLLMVALMVALSVVEMVVWWAVLMVVVMVVL